MEIADIKPDNVLLEGDGVMVADFGIARAVSEMHEKLTATGITVGTPVYMSPEQASGEKHIDGRSDQFSLACVLYEMISGEPPFKGATPTATMVRRFKGPPQPLRPVFDIPASVERAILRDSTGIRRHATRRCRTFSTRSRAGVWRPRRTALRYGAAAWERSSASCCSGERAGQAGAVTKSPSVTAASTLIVP